MLAKLGSRDLEFPSQDLETLKPTPYPYSDIETLRQQIEQDGYIFFKNILPRQAVAKARQRVLEHLASKDAIRPDSPLEEGRIADPAHTPRMLGKNEITNHPDVLAVLEHPNLFSFFEQFFGEKPGTFDWKWLRATPSEGATGVHYDNVYMGRGSERLHTAWVPLGDLTPDIGTLAVCQGSHRLPAFEPLRQGYARKDVDRDKVEGWLTREPTEITEKYGGRWATADFEMGDLMVFGMFLMHASTVNQTDRYRLSCDIRFQPAAEPFDDRWVGESPKGHHR